MLSDFDLSNKVALVAGGTGGMGSAITSRLREHGTAVVTVSRRTMPDDQHIVADLRLPENSEQAVEETIMRFGRLDIVINAMGVVAFGEVTSTKPDIVEELFMTNTFAHIFLCTAALPKMKTGGVICGVSGVIAEQNLPGMAVYGASKAAMRSFNEGLAREARRTGIRILDVRPPHTETGLATRAIAGSAPRLPLGLSPDNVAHRIVTAIITGESDVPSGEFTA